MHFSIPDTSDITENAGSTYTVFNVHINGVYHCSVRYSQFHAFHEQLKREFGATVLPQFPPKKIKILKLSLSELDERRAMIERYVQYVSQNPQIVTSVTFNTFLLNAQQLSQKEAPEPVVFDVYLMNGHHISINITSTDQTDDVLETVASKIELPSDYVYYFGLFLIKKEEGKDNAIVRRLQEFESPYISLKAANKQCAHRVVLRKSFWDCNLDDDLIDDRIGMNLLYVQAVNDVARGWVTGNKQQLKQLTVLQQRNSKKEYLRLARTLKYYGYVQFRPCVVDYPVSDCRAIIAAGNRELNFRIQVSREDDKETSFKVTRMRCWRITTLVSDLAEEGDSVPARLELSFEYLIAKDTLRWITVCSEQAILMSMCLQAMVDELILRKQGGRIKRPQDRNRNSTSSSSSQLPSPTSQPSTETAQVENDNGSNANPTVRINEKLSAMSVKQSLSQHSNGTISGSTAENSAFEGIGDDDL